MNKKMECWLLCEELTVLQAVFLMLDKDPEDYSDGDLIFSETDLPTGYRAYFSALKSAILAKRLKATIRHNATADGYLVERDDEWSAYHDKEPCDGDWPPKTPSFYFEDTPNWTETTILVEDLKEWLRGRGGLFNFFFPEALQQYIEKITRAISEKNDDDDVVDIIRGIDEEKKNIDELMSQELRVCNEAYQILKDQNNWPDTYQRAKSTEPATTPKQAIRGWLQQNYPGLGTEAINRISKVVNWDRSARKYK